MKNEESMCGIDRHARVASVDLFKFICAAFVVAIHTSALKGFAADVDFFFIHVLFRLAVPFFCMASGYFLAQSLVFENGRLKKCRRNRMHISGMWKKNAKLYVIWSLVYLIVYIPFWKRIGWLSAWAFVDWGIAAVRSGSYYHLWYVLGLLYALPLLWICLTVIERKYLPVVAVGFYLIKAVSYGYRWAFPQETALLFSALDAMGSLATAFNTIMPYILLGMIAFDRQGRGKHIRYVLFGISLLLVTVEAFALRKAGFSSYSYILFSMPAAYYFFHVVLGLNRKMKNWDFSVLAKSSVFIYCVHPAVNACMEKIVNPGPVRFATVFGISFALSMLMQYIVKSKKALRT